MTPSFVHKSEKCAQDAHINSGNFALKSDHLPMYANGYWTKQTSTHKPCFRQTFTAKWLAD